MGYEHVFCEKIQMILDTIYIFRNGTKWCVRYPIQSAGHVINSFNTKNDADTFLIRKHFDLYFQAKETYCNGCKIGGKNVHTK